MTNFDKFAWTNKAVSGERLFYYNWTKTTLKMNKNVST